MRQQQRLFVARREQLEARRCLTSITFVESDVECCAARLARSAHSVDLDRDGDLDIVFAAAIDQTIAWYENLNGAGHFSGEQLIAIEPGRIQAIDLADMDGDGDLDLISASSQYTEYQGEIAWYANTDGEGVFGTRQLITAAARGARSVQAVDFDGDGDSDALSASLYDGKIAWYENVDGRGRFGDQEVIKTLDGGTYGGAEYAIAADLDGDSDLDVLTTSREGDFDPLEPDTTGFLAWYENLDGVDQFGDRRVIWTVTYRIEAVHLADTDGDGDFDIVASSGAATILFENNNGNSRFSGTQLVVTDYTTAVGTADLDGDGDLDVITGSASALRWQRNTSGAGEFGDPEVLEVLDSAPSSIHAADLDGDGDLDLTTTANHAISVTWYENTDGRGTFGDQHALSSAVEDPTFVAAADLNGDGYLDVVATSGNDMSLMWYESTDGMGIFGEQQLIAAGINHVLGAKATTADLDGDADIDIVVVTEGTVEWYENTDGLGTFSHAPLIASGARRPLSVQAVDLDGDRDLDVLWASFWQNKVLWHENLDEFGTFGGEQLIAFATGSERVNSVRAADLDGDGDLDISLTAMDGNQFVWYENVNNGNVFRKKDAIPLFGAAWELYIEDVDGDRDLDVLLTERRSWNSPGRLTWLENVDGLGSLSDGQVLVSGIAGNIEMADLDGDGDGDITVSAGQDDEIVWLESVGLARFAPPQRVTQQLGKRAQDTAIADLDRDGDFDLIVAWGLDAKISWYENRSIGDSNDDGIFDSADLLAVLVSNKYEDGIDGHTTFDQGDWNGDGESDSSDLVLAFQSGNYRTIANARLPVVAAAVESIPCRFEPLTRRPNLKRLPKPVARKW